MSIEDDVTAASIRYEGQWSYLAMRKVDRELTERFFQQREDYWDARRGGNRDGIELQGAALVRAYDAITRAMCGHPEDAYLLTKAGDQPIAVGRNNSPSTRVPDGVVYLSIDEVGELLKGVPEFSEVAKIKAMFPGSVVAPADTLEGWEIA